jgi:hypothetical protein
MANVKKMDLCVGSFIQCFSKLIENLLLPKWEHSKTPVQLVIKNRRKYARCQWLTPVILASQEAEIRRIKVQSQPGK